MHVCEYTSGTETRLAFCRGTKKSLKRCVCVCQRERERERVGQRISDRQFSANSNFLHSPYMDCFSTYATSNCGSIKLCILLKWNEVLHIYVTAWRWILSKYFANCKGLYCVERDQDDCEGRVPASAQTAIRKSHYSNNIRGICNLVWHAAKMYLVFNIPNNCNKASGVVKVGLEVGRVLGSTRSVEFKGRQN